MKQFNIAVVGCGNVSHMHFDAYKDHLEQVRIVAACDTNRESMNEAHKKYGFEQGFTSLEAMIAQAQWDVAVVCTPTPVRKHVVTRLAAAGKHIFVEKPFADNYQDAQDMVNICAQAGVKLAVNQNFRYHYPFDMARKLITEGEIGRVMHIMHQDLMLRQDTGWRLQTKRHAMAVMGIHWLDGFRWIVGDEPVSIMAETRSSAAIECVGETEASVQVNFEKDVLASYLESFSSALARTETIILGEMGTLVLTYNDMCLYKLNDHSRPYKQWENPLRGPKKPEATFVGLNLLLASVEQGNEPANSGHDNLKTIALLDAAYRSAKTQRPVFFTGGVA
ncbi:Gfo/Idh/MocA family protein [Ktedonospora formicarum]|uniref:Oxidoreductase n=1 Tax=Ktedonospora formicarum TaxID=2778364 RepID=A0A8J3MSC1_9CHLR|nr:Gfo/Idh/MocA family oxidoreductase [Ktedonospora formicarum]GHO46932.1 oxidoreductase [Ktedonospora formicarum]